MFNIVLIPSGEEVFSVHEDAAQTLAETGKFTCVITPNAVIATRRLKGEAPQLVVCSQRQAQVWADHATLGQLKAYILVLRDTSETTEKVPPLYTSVFLQVGFADITVEADPRHLVQEIVAVAAKIQEMPTLDRFEVVPLRPISDEPKAGSPTPVIK